MKEIGCHGTYINDHRRWKQIRKLTLSEAANMLSITDEQRPDRNTPCSYCKNELPQRKTCHICEGTGKRDEYMWLNKGYIIVELHPVTKEFRFSDVKIGMHAVYLHDGRYYLYQYQETAQ